jgi:hypothetical protein
VSSQVGKIGSIKNKSGFVRSEFIEVLVRISKFKFLETGICPSYHEAFNHLIENFIKPNFNLLPWQEFRTNELWTLEVNDVMETNMVGLKKLFAFYMQGPNKKYFSVEDAMRMFLKDQSELPLTNVQAKYAIAYC